MLNMADERLEDLALKDWVEKTVQERWDRENNDFLAPDFEKDILMHPDRIPSVQPGNPRGSAILYDRSFVSVVVPRIVSASKSREEAQKYIDQIFRKIRRYTEKTADGDHHSPTYREPIFTQWYISTDGALI